MTVGCAEKTIELGLELARLAYLTGTVRVMVIKDAGTIRVGEVGYELRKGTEIELPRWLARLLSEKGVVEIVETPITLEDIARFHFGVMSARNVAEMEPLPQHFYQQVSEYVAMLDSRIRREFNAALLEEKQKASTYAAEIAMRRLAAILQVLRSPASMGELYGKLTVEERILIDVLYNALEKWRKMISKMLQGGER